MNKAIETPAMSLALEELESRFGDRVQTSESVCAQYSRDESFHVALPPNAVIQPESAG